MSESHWVDVTKDAAFIPDSTAGEFCLEIRGEQSFTGYRIRKVKISIHDHSPDAPLDPVVEAFIVERCKP